MSQYVPEVELQAMTPEQIFERMQDAQTALWACAGRLEEISGSEIDTTQDLCAVELADLIGTAFAYSD